MEGNIEVLWRRTWMGEGICMFTHIQDLQNHISLQEQY